jgi:hypothetical protein
VSRIVSLSVVAVMIGAAVGVGLVATWAAIGAPTLCVRSEPVATLPTLTPFLIVNSPYGGFANGTWTQYDNTSTSRGFETQSIGARNGSTSYLFGVVDWTVWTTKRIGNPSGTCAGIFASSEGKPSVVAAASTGANYTSDQDAPQATGNGSVLNSTTAEIPGGPFAPLFFNDSFYSARAYTTSNCADAGEGGVAVSSTFMTYRIPFEYRGAPHIASITVSQLTNYTYSFATGGIWEVDDLAGVGGPGGGDSFSFTSCPDEP